LLEQTGRFDVKLCVNGFEAFKTVSEGFTKEPKDLFDLVLLDLNMPVIDGFEASLKIHNFFIKECLFKLTIVRKNLLPLLIACSANELTNELEK